MAIHKTALISPDATLDESVEVGAYAVVEGKVKIGANTKLHPHTYITGTTTIGEGCEIFPFASVGAAPQDLKYQNEDSRTIIGDRTIVREGVTVNRGTAAGIMETRIGNDCLLMATSHVSHDTILGNNVILANAVLLAGHCELGCSVFVGGGTVMQQYIKIGAHAFIAGSSGLAGHVPPFASVFGTPALWVGVNVIGLKRRGFSLDAVKTIRKFYNQFFKMEGTGQMRIAALEKEFSSTETDEAITFIKDCLTGKHAIIQARR